MTATLDMNTVGSLLLKIKNDPTLWGQIMDQILAKHTATFIKAASEIGLTDAYVDIPSHLGLNIASIPQSIFNEISRACGPVGGNLYSTKVNGINEARARLNIGLKEAKDLVEHFFNFSPYRY